MSVEVLVTGVGAVLLLILLLMVLKDMCDKKDPNESESWVLIGKRFTDLNGMCFFLFYSSFSARPAGKGSLLQSLCSFPRQPSSPPIPGPPCRFLIGNMTELMQDHLPIHLTDLAKRYGNIYRLKCGNTSNYTELHLQKGVLFVASHKTLLFFSAAMVVLNSGDIIREALVKKWSDFAGRAVSYTGKMAHFATQMLQCAA